MIKFATLLAAAALALPAAERSDTSATEGRHQGPHHQQRLAKFDTDHDGKLSDSERQAAREALAARLKEKHPQLFAKIDTNGDGTLSKEECQAARKMLQELRAKHHDKQGQADGK